MVRKGQDRWICTVRQNPVLPRTLKPAPVGSSNVVVCEVGRTTTVRAVVGFGGFVYASPECFVFRTW